MCAKRFSLMSLAIIHNMLIITKLDNVHFIGGCYKTAYLVAT